MTSHDILKSASYALSLCEMLLTAAQKTRCKKKRAAILLAALSIAKNSNASCP